MIKYIKDSIRELKHVVWPTRTETTNYFVIVVIVLVLFGIYLFIASTLFTKGLFGLKEVVDNNKSLSEVVIPEGISSELKVISDESGIKKVELNDNSTGSTDEANTGSTDEANTGSTDEANTGSTDETNTGIKIK